MLKGQKVLLRPLRRSDIAYLLKWFNDPEVLQYLNLHLPMTEMGEEKYIEELGASRARTEVVFVIEAIEGDSNKPIGSIGLDNINSKDHDALFGVIIGEKDYWSKGYGTEAASLLVGYGFEQLNLNRITSHVVDFNERSISMHKRLGFKEEGRMRQATFKNGEYHDYLVFGLLREEWERL